MFFKKYPREDTISDNDSFGVGRKGLKVRNKKDAFNILGGSIEGATLKVYDWKGKELGEFVVINKTQLKPGMDINFTYEKTLGTIKEIEALGNKSKVITTKGIEFYIEIIDDGSAKRLGDQIYESRSVELIQVTEMCYSGKLYGPDGDQIWNPKDAIPAYGLNTLTKNQIGHGAIKIPGTRQGIEILIKILSKTDTFRGDCGPIARSPLSKVNKYINTYENSEFIMTRNHTKVTGNDGLYEITDKNGHINTDSLEVILNAEMSVYGKDLKKLFPKIIFKSYRGKRF